jgi:hypothetical protein
MKCFGLQRVARIQTSQVATFFCRAPFGAPLPSKTAENPTKSRDIAFARLGMCALPRRFILLPFSFFQGRSRKSALDVAMAEHDHRGYIVDATRSMHGKAVSPFLIENRLAVSNLWPRADGHGRFGS